MKALILFGVLLVVGAAAHPIHLSFIMLGRHMNLPTWSRDSLPYVPAAMLTILVVPNLLMRNGVFTVSVDNPCLLADVVAIIITQVAKNAIRTIVDGTAVLLILVKVMV